MPTSVGSLKKHEFFLQKNICFIDYAKVFDCVDHNKLWKILQEMGIPDHLTCLLRNLYAGQEATVRIGHGTTHCFQIGTSLLFHVQFYWLLLVPLTDLSGDRSGGLIFPSLSGFSIVCCDPHSQGFSIVNEAEVDDFLQFSCFFYEQTDVGNLISGSSPFSKSSLNIWKFSDHLLLKPSLENFEHYFTSM